MRFLTSGQIRDFEGEIITDVYSSLRLIDSAANACAKELSHFGAICIFCGKGNNGADGYRLAKLLHEGGAAVKIVRVFEPGTEECKMLAEECEGDDIPAFGFDEDGLSKALSDCRAVVDAIFGIGIKGEVAGTARRAIEFINGLGTYVLSVDIPSGLDADSGEVCGVCVKADKTVTFTAPKLGMLSGAGVDHCGEIVIRYVDIPVNEGSVPEWQPVPLTEELAAGLLPKRPRLSHKGTFGRALMVVGSPGMLGAAAMAARSAMRSGVGLVTIMCRRGLENTLNIMVPEAVVLPVDDYSMSLPEIKKAVESADAVLVGCGIGRSISVRFITELLDAAKAPVIIDADGLNILSGRPELLSGRNVVITPHPLEFARLTGISVAEQEKDRVGAARTFAEKYGVTLVLKGARTVIASPGGTAAVSLMSTSALAKAGSGDTLAGLLCALCAQGLPADDAARLGVYLHARAGMISAVKNGEYSTTVGDITDCLKYAFMEVSAHGSRQSVGGDKPERD